MVEEVKVRYIGDHYKVTLINGKIYDVTEIEEGFYRVKDEIDDALYSPVDFETIEDKA